MTHTEYMRFVADAREQSNRMVWVAEYGYPADCPYSGDNLLQVLSIIYAVAHDNLLEIIKIAGGGAAVSRKFQIPYSTMTKWTSGVSKPAPYAMRLIGLALISDIPTEETDES